MSKDYWFFTEGTDKMFFDTLNEARAHLYELILNGTMIGGVIFGPRSIGTMIMSHYGVAVWTGRRAVLRPVKEDGTLYPDSRTRVIRGF